MKKIILGAVLAATAATGALAGTGIGRLESEFAVKSCYTVIMQNPKFDPSFKINGKARVRPPYQGVSRIEVGFTKSAPFGEIKYKKECGYNLDAINVYEYSGEPTRDALDVEYSGTELIQLGVT